MGKTVLDRYFSQEKILRDLAHQYINLTEFDITLIDTPHFQRLKDIRQLTCQHVYPSARHTRFEHSLGVMELTRRAMKRINRNGYIGKSMQTGEKIIPRHVEFATAMAALLHDVGHSPFSHLGEQQMDRDTVRQKLLLALDRSGILQNLYPKATTDPEDSFYPKDLPGATHEWMSCIVILCKYNECLNEAFSEISKAANEKSTIDVLEHIVRCVIGFPYSDPHDQKNISISLINGEALDMDKLDYIMRDSLYTGVSVPSIDTKRLFNNMFISRQNQVIFTSKAVPALQTIIETRDNLYLWVYNHHTTVYTDFLYYYILRRLEKNYNVQIRGDEKGPSATDKAGRSYVGAYRKEDLFSVEAVMENLVSDSDVLYLLNAQHRADRTQLQAMDESTERTNRNRALDLISNLQSRKLLKPWWKTVYEYQNFMNSKFMDDSVRSGIAAWACGKKDRNMAPEFRSMVAKSVIALSVELKEKGSIERALCDGEFFLVERSNKFYQIPALEKILVYLKENEILTATVEREYVEGNYYGKKLTKLIPQREYSSILDSESFYLYLCKYESSGLASEERPEDLRRKFYDEVEKLFLLVASTLGAMSVQEFRAFLAEYDGESAKPIKMSVFRKNAEN